MQNAKRKITDEMVREYFIIKALNGLKLGAFFCYLKDKKETCVIELWQEALHNFGTKPTKKDSTEIGLIMQGMKEWERIDVPKRMGEFGLQRYWRKKNIQFWKYKCYNRGLCNIFVTRL